MKHFLYKYLLFLLCFITLSQSAFAKDIRFIQVTDLHYKNITYFENLFNKIIDDVNSVKNVQFTVFTGDNIDHANIADLTAFLKLAKRLNMPYYIVLGNHDVFKSGGLSKEEYLKLIKKYNKYQKTSKSNFEFEKDGVLFVVLDGAKEAIPGPGGYYKPETLTWLNKTLTKNKDKNVVILQHFPLKQRFTERDAYKIERYQKLLTKHSNVIGVFAGHFHANEEYIQNGIFYSITGRASGPDAGYKIVDMVQEKNPDTKKLEYKFYTQMVTFE